MKNTSIKAVILSIIFASLLLSVGCGKLTKDNYDKLKVGLDYSEVINILGQADECSGAIGIKNCRWGDDKKYIEIKFAANKVVIFSGHGL